MRIGVLEPHLRRYGGIRRMIEFSNRLVDRGHDVRIYVDEGASTHCTWMHCAAPVTALPEGLDDELDVLLFNDERQWHLVAEFRRAARRGFYALHAGWTYGKEGSWEASRLDVDLRLANSGWTADMLAAEAGARPEVVLGGINPEHFRPVAVGGRRYPLLCVGDRRPWKGTDVIDRAAALLGLPVERYAGKDLPQERMAEEYCRAEVFVVGSSVEGFGQPGLEALACGTPLVTTDNGGCREYAVHDETALVVPPGDPEAMAAAIDRLRRDPALARRLSANGLALVGERFDWERATDRLEALLSDAVAGAAPVRAPRPLRHAPPEVPSLSVVVLAWDQLAYTQRCVESARRHTDVPYELVLVDNGSAWQGRTYAGAAADTAVLNPDNRGFAAGMNQGLAAARGSYVAFVNNDVELPPGWAGTLLETAAASPRAAIVVPALTAAGNPRTVRAAAGSEVEVLLPFEPPPSAVVYVMPTQLARALGGFDEGYEIAGGEDVDLAFTAWVNDLDIVFDQRVLVRHVGKGTAAVKLDDWRALWNRNGERFLAKWTDPAVAPVRLPDCPPQRWARNRDTARAVAGWMSRYFAIRGRSFPGKAALRAAAGRLRRFARQPAVTGAAVTAWERLGPLLPPSLRSAARRRAGGIFDRVLMVRHDSPGTDVEGQDAAAALSRRLRPRSPVR